MLRRPFILLCAVGVCFPALMQSAPINIDSVDRDITAYAQVGYLATTNQTIESSLAGDFNQSFQREASSAGAYAKSVASQNSTVVLTNTTLVVKGNGTTHVESRAVNTRGLASCDSQLNGGFTLTAPCAYSLSVNIQSDAPSDFFNETDAGLSGGTVDISFGGALLVDAGQTSGILQPGSYNIGSTSLLTSQSDPPPLKPNPTPNRNAQWQLEFVAAPLPNVSSAKLTSSRQQNSILVQWPLSAFLLQSATNLSAPVTWRTLTNCAIVGQQWTYTNQTDGKTRFFRLKK